MALRIASGSLAFYSHIPLEIHDWHLGAVIRFLILEMLHPLVIPSVDPFQFSLLDVSYNTTIDVNEIYRCLKTPPTILAKRETITLEEA